MLQAVIDKIWNILPSRTNEIVLRDATQKDTRFVINLIKREAKAGHFVGWKSPFQKVIFAGLIRHMLIPEHRWPLNIDAHDPNKDKFVHTRLWIGEAGRRRVGFLAIREVTPGSFQKEVEIWMVAVVPERRGSGAGRVMVDLVINTLTEQVPKRKITARCLPASQVMFDMLKRRGFRLIRRMPDGTRLLERKPKK